MITRRKINPKKGSLDIPGGYLEDGENPVAGLRREISEELGVQLSHIKLFGVYTDTYYEKYRFYTLNLAYTCRIAKGKPRPMDDVAEIVWLDKRIIQGNKLAFGWIKKAFRDLK